MKSDLSQGSTSCMKPSRMHRFAASVDQAPRIVDICLSASKMQVPWSEHIESNKRNNYESQRLFSAPCAISSALGRPSLLVKSATFWAMCGRSKWHTTPCAIWSAFGRLLFQVRYVLLACQHPESAAFSLKRR